MSANRRPESVPGTGRRLRTSAGRLMGVLCLLGALAGCTAGEWHSFLHPEDVLTPEERAEMDRRAIRRDLRDCCRDAHCD